MRPNAKRSGATRASDGDPPEVPEVPEVPAVPQDDRSNVLHPAGGLRRAARIAEAVGLDEPVHDRDHIAAEVDLPEGETRAWWRAMGIVEVPDGVIAFGDQDLLMARTLATVLDDDVASRDHLMRLARLLGGSFSRIADAQVAVLDQQLVDRLGAEGLDTPEHRAEALGSPEARELLEIFEHGITYVWRRHLFATLGRWVGADEDQALQAVGFADISRFSSMSKGLEADELTRLIETFERESLDVVTAHDGRVVKFIGDEVLYVVDDLGVAVDIALELGQRMAACDPPVALHCGIGWGPTVTIGGDVFGNTVNLAKRLAAVARRGKVVLTRESSKLLADRPELQAHRVARVFELKGVGRTPIVSMSRRVVAEADEEPADGVDPDEPDAADQEAASADGS